MTHIKKQSFFKTCEVTPKENKCEHKFGYVEGSDEIRCVKCYSPRDYTEVLL